MSSTNYSVELSNYKY